MEPDVPIVLGAAVLGAGVAGAVFCVVDPVWASAGAAMTVAASRAAAIDLFSIVEIPLFASG